MHKVSRVMTILICSAMWNFRNYPSNTKYGGPLNEFLTFIPTPTAPTNLKDRSRHKKILTLPVYFSGRILLQDYLGRVVWRSPTTLTVVLSSHLLPSCHLTYCRPVISLTVVLSSHLLSSCHFSLCIDRLQTLFISVPRPDTIMRFAL